MTVKKICNVWEYISKNFTSCTENIMTVIEDDVDDMSLQMWIEETGSSVEDSTVCFQVEFAGSVIDSKVVAYDEDAVMNTVDEFTTRYFDDEETRAEANAEVQEEAIAERECQLQDAVYAMLDVFLSETACDAKKLGEVVDDMVKIVGEYLYRTHNLSIYQPMMLDCADGTQEYSEFPYPEIDYGD